MSDGESIDKDELEYEKGKSYELGRLSQLEDLGEEFRKRAGDKWGSADTRKQNAQAKLLKDLAREFEERGEDRRDEWDKKVLR